MTRPPAHVLLLLAVFVAGISWLFLVQPAGAPAARPPAVGREEAATPAGLEALAPSLRGLRVTLTDATEQVRAARALVLAALDALPPPSRPWLARALAHGDWAVQWAGLLGMPRYGEPDADLLEALGPLLRSEETVVRRAAAEASVALGEQAGPLEAALRALAADGEASVRASALRALGRRAALRLDLVPLFSASAADPDPVVRGVAVAALAQVEACERLPPDELRLFVAALRPLLLDPVADVRMYAAMALGRAGAGAAPAIPALVALLEDDHALVQSQASTALGSLGPLALPALEGALQGEDGSRALPILWALRLVGEPALPTLERAMRHASALVRVHAAMKRWEIAREPEATVAVLAAALQADDPDAVLQAARGLGRIGPEARAAVGPLEALGGHEDGAIRRAVEGALAAIRPPGPGR